LRDRDERERLRDKEERFRDGDERRREATNGETKKREMGRKEIFLE
jgi:hypothetical protein